MSPNRPRVIATSGWCCAGVSGQAPLKRQSLAAEPQRANAPRISLRQLFEAIRLRVKPPRRTGGPTEPRRTGGPTEPPRSSEREAHWDDPALWMLMMH